MNSMQTSDVIQQLFPTVDSGRIRTLLCPHVIPAENLMAAVVSCGPTGKVLNFSFANRSKDSVINELGIVLVNVATIVKSGVVVFLPSFAYAQTVEEKWTDNGTLDRLKRRKKVK